MGTKSHVELSKLAALLGKANIPFEIVAWVMCGEPCLQICSPSKKNCKVDAASHSFIYGGSEGLLEVMGSVNKNLENDDVVGWLTAAEAFDYFIEE